MSQARSALQAAKLEIFSDAGKRKLSGTDCSDCFGITEKRSYFYEKNAFREQSMLPKDRLRSTFRYIAEMTSRRMGSPVAFFSALFLIILWAASGFYLGFDERWQLIINTGTTIATFLMVILIQNTQYREARSTQLKLNEILYGTKNTRDSFLEIEEESDEELDLLKEEFKELRKKYLNKMRNKKT